MAKGIEDCQTSAELAESIEYHLKQGGMCRDIMNLDTGERKTVYDDFETRRVYGMVLNKYTEIRESYPNLPPAQIDSSDPLSGLAQIKQLCTTRGGKAGDKKPKGLINNRPVTLVQFMQEYCDSKGYDIGSKKFAIYKANKGRLQLPRLAKKWRTGQPKIFYASDLRKKWPEYCKIIPTLPPLKQQKQAEA